MLLSFPRRGHRPPLNAVAVVLNLLWQFAFLSGTFRKMGIMICLQYVGKSLIVRALVI